MDKKAMMLGMLKRVIGPPEVVSGLDSVRRLQTLPDGKVLVVMSPSAQANETHDKILDYLTKGGLESSVCVVPSGEPTLPVTKKLTEHMDATEPEWIVAAGGGSVLDAAKIAWACHEHPELDFAQPPPLRLPKLREKARLIAIPTTAGSGAEASQAAVLKEPGLGSVRAYVSTEWIPDIAILDPRLCVSMDRTLTACTGMDALTHAVEAYVSRLSSPLVKIISGTATRLILSNLGPACDEPDDLRARENVLNASYLAGLAQSAASTGLSHALTHASSAVYGSSHGVGNALFLAPGIRLNQSKNEALYDELAQDLGCSPDDFVNAIEALTEAIGLPHRLSDLGDRPVDDTGLSSVVENAQGDVTMRTNPVRFTDDELMVALEKLR